MLRSGSSAIVELGPEVGRGGEAVVYRVVGDTRFVAKVYEKAASGGEREERLSALVQLNKPAGVAAWPVDLLYSSTGCVGFLMPLIRGCKPVISVYAPRQRPVGFTWEYQLAVAENLCRVVGMLHRTGFVVGDLNEMNALVGADAGVVLIDADSMQFSSGSSTWNCGVVRPGYCAPELIGSDLRLVRRDPASDSFALAVLLFQLLALGKHPFDGNGGAGIERNIAGDRSFVVDSTLQAPPGVPLGALPSSLRSLFERAFGIGCRVPAQRPSPQEWSLALSAVRGALASCPASVNHRYSGILPGCPWCELRERTGWDAYPGSPAAASPSDQSDGPPTSASTGIDAVEALSWLVPLAIAAWVLWGIAYLVAWCLFDKKLKVPGRYVPSQEVVHD